MQKGKMKMILDWIFPRRCAICDEPLPPGEFVCKTCKMKVRFIQGDTCYKCGKSVGNGEEYCFDCRRLNHLYTQGAALFDYSSIHYSLYKFKYASRIEYADYYGMEMARVLHNKILSWNAEAIIPVPLHKDKEKKRGYNQAKILADALSLNIKIPCYDNLIYRVKNTIPMKELDVRERQINLKNAFIMGQYDVKLKGVIVVDDIYTTGSTINSITKELLNNGVHNVYFLTLAIGAGL